MHEYRLTDSINNRAGYLYVFSVKNKAIEEFFSLLSDVQLDDLTGLSWTKSTFNPGLSPVGGYKLISEDEFDLEEEDLPADIQEDVDTADTDGESSDGGDAGSSSDGGGSDGGGDGGD